jgi:hypothetical protein
MGKLDDLIAAVGKAAPESKYIRAYHGIEFPAISASSPPYYSMPAERISAVAASGNQLDAAVAAQLMSGAGPREWRRAREFLGDNRLRLGELIGAGRERLAFEAGMPGQPASQVFKIGGPKDTYDMPAIPGVAPYRLRGSEGELNFGVQERALGVHADGKLPYEYWLDRADDLHTSLYRRGYTWIDPHEGNIGLMPDRTWAVIDGPIEPHRSATPYAPGAAEEAIRLLRMSP